MVGFLLLISGIFAFAARACPALPSPLLPTAVSGYYPDAAVGSNGDGRAGQARARARPPGAASYVPRAPPRGPRAVPGGPRAILKTSTGTKRVSPPTNKRSVGNLVSE